MTNSNLAGVAPAQTEDAYGPVVLQQLADLIKTAYRLHSAFSASGTKFRTKSMDPPRHGVKAVRAELTSTNLIVLELELLRTEIKLRPALDELWNRLSELKDGVRPVPIQTVAGGQSSSFRLELKISASSTLNALRHAVICQELERIDAIAKWAESEIPQSGATAELDTLYSDASDVLQPVYPLPDQLNDLLSELNAWARETIEFMHGGLNVALAVSGSASEQLCLAALARETMAGGVSMGYLQLPGLSGKNLIEIAARAPGCVVIPIQRVCMGLSPYEIADHMRTLLDCLTSAGTPALFTGTHVQLQRAFHGGQGSTSDPLAPLLRDVPECPIPCVTRFTVEQAARRADVPDRAIDELTSSVTSGLGEVAETEQLRLLPVLTGQAVHAWKAGSGGTTSTSGSSFAKRASEVHESLAGVKKSAPLEHSKTLEKKLIAALGSGQLHETLKSRLLAQDLALGELVDRLRTETFTRPGHQPIRYLAEGTPATGKSDSAAIIAEVLGLPLVTIDAASMSDFYVASAQLLGSGRGIVGSQESGRLEKAAKNSHGVVVEIADLDHARESVRSGLSDLFLQMLELGHFQTATGAIVSAANMILAFTVNLPNAADERLRIPMGFNAQPTELEVEHAVGSELKKLFSTAFLSRIGKPILFQSLGGDQLAIIAERSVLTALQTALDRLGFGEVCVDLADGLGAALIASMNASVSSHGARAVAEHARTSAALAVSSLASENINLSGTRMIVSHPGGRNLKIEVQH